MEHHLVTAAALSVLGLVPATAVAQNLALRFDDYDCRSMLRVEGEQDGLLPVAAPAAIASICRSAIRTRPDSRSVVNNAGGGTPA